MEVENKPIVRKRRIGRKLLYIAAAITIILGIAGYYLYTNVNRLLAQALVNSFNAGSVSDVYDLKFERLSVNIMVGSIQVRNVELTPRPVPTVKYSYINSSLKLRADKILLSKVDIYTLLKTNILKLQRIEIMEPEIEIKLAGRRNIFFPFNDTSTSNQPDVARKSFIDAFLLKEFAIVNASLTMTNEGLERDLAMKNLSVSLKDLMIKQVPGRDVIANRLLDLSIGEVTWRLKNGGVQSIRVSEYKLKMDSLALQNSADTFIYRFKNFSTGLKVLNMQTEDSLFNLSMQSFNLSYRDKSITLKGIKFDPNISDAAMQRRFVYQNPIFSGTVGTIKLVGLNFDSLIYVNKIFADEVELDKLSVEIFKDLTKPVNPKKFPDYPGQQIRSIGMPLKIGTLTATNVNLENVEKRAEGGRGKVIIKRMRIHAKNITNLSSGGLLTVNADGFLESKAHVFLDLQFSYGEPKYTMNARIGKFNLPDLNNFLSSYTPATVLAGTADQVTLSATAYRTYSSGTLKFLYHGLDVDLNLKNQPKWKSDLLTFVGNTITESSNPPSEDKPVKVVKFRAERDMHKGFVNILIKSAIAGCKETMFMSKQNRQQYRETKKKARKDNKNDKPTRAIGSQDE